MESLAASAMSAAVRTALESAVQCCERGDHAAAEQLFQEALRADPDNLQALHGSGVLALQTGDFSLARERLGRAIGLGISWPVTHSLLGRAFRGIGDLEAAVESYARAIAAAPDMTDAHVALGLALKDLGRLDEAEKSYRKALSCDPVSFEARVNLANLLQLQSRLEEALTEYGEAAKLRPNSPQLQYNLGKVLRAQGRHLKAAEHFKRAVELDPDFLEACFNLANALSSAGLYSEAIDCFQHLRAVIESGAGRPTDSAARERLLRDTLTSLASPLAWSQRFEEAQPLLEAALAREPDSAALFEYRLLMLPYRCESQRDIVEAYRRYQRMLPAQPPGPPEAVKREKSASRLRLGYVSGDFRDHSISFFLEPLLANHDREGFEIVCYSMNQKDDAVTARLMGYAGDWINVSELNDIELERKIRVDGIDVLIDLSGRTVHNRQGVFIRQPAPLQVGYLGYPTYTGIPQLAWRITDAIIDPLDGEGLETERPLRLSRSAFCYRPPTDAPAVAQPATARSGSVSFGSFNQIQKLSPTIIAAWARILAAVPDSRLILKAFGFADARQKERVLGLFANAGVEVGRIEAREPVADRGDHLSLYNEVDIALDTFPYNGTTTTCEALWMGVPVVTLAGETHASRVGASLLDAMDLPELVAASVEQYVATAVRMARDPHKLREFRDGLRGRFAASPLRDEQGFARAFERALRKAWRMTDGIHV